MKLQKITLFVLLAAVGTMVKAQQKLWTLSECIDYAIEHNYEVKKSQNQVDALKLQRNSLKSKFLPNLNAGASHNFAFGRSLNQNNTYENSNIQNSSFSLTTELNLFSGFKRLNSISQNKYDLLAAEADKELIKNNLVLQITNLYFQILLNKEILNIANEQIELTKEQQIRTNILIDNGKVSKSQIHEVNAQLADDELAATEANNNLKYALLELMQAMEMDQYDNFDIDSIEVDPSAIESLDPIAIYQSSLGCMPQIKQAYYSLQSKSKGIQIAKSGYYPTLSFGAGISTGYYHYGERFNEAFRKQLNNNMQKSIYLTLSIPLFDRFETRNLVKSKRIEADNARLQLEEEKKLLYKDIQKAYADALAAYEKLNATKKAVLANQEAHRYALEKYAAGKSSVFEYNEVKMKMADALSRHSQAKYTYLLKERILRFYSCLSITDSK